MNIVDALAREPEPLPGWLRRPTPGFDRTEFFASRTVYYPGAGFDGHALRICAEARAAHAFVHVDYGLARKFVVNRLRRGLVDGVRGYAVELQEDVGDTLLRPRAEAAHADWDDIAPARYASTEPYALYTVLKRGEGCGASRGPERLAVLFVGGDGHLTFDALYCQDDGTPPPFLTVVQDHGFGGNYDLFGAGGLLETLARTCGAYPEWLLLGEHAGRLEPWSGYRDTGAVPEPGGGHKIPRRLFRREAAPQ